MTYSEEYRGGRGLCVIIIYVRVFGAYQFVLFQVSESDRIEDLFQKFMFTGDDRNICDIYVRGELVLKDGEFKGDSLVKKT